MISEGLYIQGSPVKKTISQVINELTLNVMSIINGKFVSTR